MKTINTLKSDPEAMELFNSTKKRIEMLESKGKELNDNRKKQKMILEFADNNEVDAFAFYDAITFPNDYSVDQIKKMLLTGKRS